LAISSRSRKRRSRAVIAWAFTFFILVQLLQNAAAVPIFTKVNVPQIVDSGQPIPVSVNLTSDISIYEVRISYTNPTTGISQTWMEMNRTSGDNNTGTWSYTIPAQSWEGRLDCIITAKDISGASSQRSATISITGEPEPKPFPWNLVLIIMFLGVALVLTELAFKPGIYRKTGRQRARELEEEDMKREQEKAESEEAREKV
jgi:hypothetical protein